MNRKTFRCGALIMCVLIAGACGLLGGGGNSLSIKTPDGKTQQIELRSGAFITVKGARASGDVTEHLVCLANFEMQIPAGAKSSDLEKAVNENQVKVCFKINGPKGFDENAQIKPGKYPMASFSGDYKPDRVGLSPSIRTFENSKENKYLMKSNGTEGEVEITSASDDKISGNINLHDDKSEIKGSFTAEKVKKG
jgi:hypothetical protein